MDRGPSSDDLIREAKTWADPPPIDSPPSAAVAPPALAPRPAYPSDRIRRPDADAPSPPPAPQSPHAPGRRSRGTGIRFALLVALTGLALTAFFAVRATGGSEQMGIFSVTPGTCFMDPSGASVAEVEVVACTDSHDLEAFAVVTLPYSQDVALPGDDELFATAYDHCLPFFEDYTGEAYETSRWYLDAFVPDRRHWKAGGRDALCVLFLAGPDGSLVPAAESAHT